MTIEPEKSSILFPSAIFGPKKEEDVSTQQTQSNVVATRVFDRVKGKKLEKNEISGLILSESKNDIKIARLALKKLIDADIPEDQKAILKEIDNEFVSIFTENISRTLEYISPKEISLREGELPSIPEKHREVISRYLKGEIDMHTAINKLELDRDSVKNILKSIKVMDLEIDRLPLEEKEALKHIRGTYELRTLCLQASEGTMNSYEAYTKSINPRFFENPFSSVAREYASHEYNYIPERVRDHIKVLHGYGIEMMALSRRLALPHRVFYCIGGNSGVGKTRCAKMDPEFSKGLLEGEMVGALSLDTLKGNLRKNIPKVTNQQIHTEGSVLAGKLASELENKALHSSVIIDERLGTIEGVKRLLTIAKSTDTAIRYKDIEGTLLVSCLRVLARDIKTEPCLSFAPIASGFKIIPEQRDKIIDICINDATIESYQLFVANEKGMQELAAEKKEGIFTIYNRDLYEKSMKPPTDEEIEKTKNLVISDAFISASKGFVGIDQAVLEKYKGLTIEEALERHSKELP
ncbi:MAG: hypothetical protein K940chlam6_00995 [Chlamydiae bacterium]|nr:hypothetical protein [Chlamydiota bacterium]